MATYEIKSPDGQTWEVNAPDTASEAEVMTYAQAQWQPTRPAGGGRGFANPADATDTKGQLLREAAAPDLSQVGRANLTNRWVGERLQELKDINPGASVDQLAALAGEDYKRAASAPIEAPVDRVRQYIDKKYDVTDARANAKFDEGVQNRINLKAMQAAPDERGNRVNVGYNPNTEAERVVRESADLTDLRDTAAGRAASAEMNPILRGAVKGGVQSVGLTAATVGYLADVVGADAVRQWGLDTNNTASKIANQMTLAKGASEIQSMDDLQTWMAENGGYVAYQAAEALLTGGMVSGMSKQAARQAAIEATALGMNNLRQTLGSVYSDAVDEAKRTGKDPSLLGVALGAVGSAAIDTFADKSGLDALGKSSFKGAVLERMAKSIGSQAAIQGGTEALQLVPEEMGTGRDPFRDGMGAQYFDEAAVGALGGGGPGVIGGLHRAPPTPTGPSAMEMATSRGFLTQPAAPTAPRVEDQSTTPVAPTVAPRAPAATGLESILRREGLINPKVADPIAPMNDEALLAGVPLEETATPNAVPEVPGGAPAVQPAGVDRAGQAAGTAAAVVPNPVQPGAAQPVAPSTPVQPVAATLPQAADPRTAALAKLEADLQASKARQEAAAQAQATTAQAEQEKLAQADLAARSVGSAYQQTSATPTAQPGAVPSPQLVTRMVQRAADTFAKNSDLTDARAYPEPVLYGIINSRDVGPDLLAAARTELDRRRGTLAQPTVSYSGAAHPGTTSLGVGGQSSAVAAPNVAGQTAVLQQEGSGATGVPAGTPSFSNQPTTRTNFQLADPVPSQVIELQRGPVRKAKGVEFKVSARPLTREQELVSAMARMMGKNLSWIERDSGKQDDMPDGFVTAYGGKYILMDVNGSKPLLEILLHEGTHALPQHIRSKLLAFVLPRVSAQGQANFLDRYGYENQAQGVQNEEVLAYVAQQIARRPEFIQDLKTALGNKDFAELARVLISKMKDWLGKGDSQFDREFLGQHVQDVQGIHDELVKAYTQAMQEQGLTPDAAVVSGGPAYAAKQTKPRPDAAIGDRTDVSALPQGKAVPASAAVGGLESSLAIARGKTYTKGRELKADIQSAVLQAAQTAGVKLNVRTQETHKFLAGMVFADAAYALRSNENAIGWYDSKISRAIGALAVVHPEINTDPTARLAFMWSLAVTSNGLKVGKNFELAEAAYRSWRDSNSDIAKRTLPENIGIGNAAQAINDGMALFNSLSTKMGQRRLAKFMATEFPAGSIAQMLGVKAGGEWAGTPVRGAAILGPKIGNGFYMNLNGYFDALTMDRWLMRTFGRMTGTLLEIDQKKISKARAKFKTAVAKLSRAERSSLTKVVGLPVKASMTASQLDILAAAVEKASMKTDKRAAMQTSDTLNRFRLDGRGLAKSIDGQKEAPSGPGERNWIRAIFKTALDQLKADGKDMTMSDLQALLWYPERRLYDAAKADDTMEEGYEDDEAPDYANAAMALAVANGYSREAVTAAMDAAESAGTIKAETLTEAEKAAFAKEFRAAPAQGVQLAFEVAPDPNNVEATNQWNALSLKDRTAITKGVKDAFLPEIFALVDAEAGKSAGATGGYAGLVNPNIITEYKPGKVSLDKARALASAIGIALDQDSVAVVDPRIETVNGLIRVTFSGKVEKHAKAIFDHIHGAIPEVDAFTARGNNFDILNFTGLSNDDLGQQISDALDSLDIDLESVVSSGDTRSELIEKDGYEEQIRGARPGAGQEVYDRALGVRDRVRALVTERVGAKPVPGSAGAVQRGSGAPGDSGQVETVPFANKSSDGLSGVHGESGPGARAHAVRVEGTHFSQQQRTSLDGRYNGRGLKGAEGTRLAQATDSRIKERVYFYVNEGKGLTPEAGVGGYAHAASIDNLYNVQGDPLKLFKSGDANGSETRVLDAGFDGYYFPNYVNGQGIAIVLGNASRGIKVTQSEYTKGSAPAAIPQPYKRGLSSKELNAIDVAAVQAVAPSAKLRAGTFQVDESELDAARSELANQGIELPATAAFSNKPNLDQDIVLEIPMDTGKTAKLTVNAGVYIKQLDARQSALEMVKECML